MSLAFLNLKLYTFYLFKLLLRKVSLSFHSIVNEITQCENQYIEDLYLNQVLCPTEGREMADSKTLIRSD